MGRKEQRKKDHCAYQEDPPVKGKDKTHRSSNSLSSPELQVKRKIMSQNTARRRIQTQKRKNISISLSKENTHKNNRCHTLQTVPQKCQDPRLFSRGTQGIGSSCISASVFSDICFMKPSDNVRSLKQPAYISDGQTNQTLHNRSYSFSPR